MSAFEEELLGRLVRGRLLDNPVEAIEKPAEAIEDAARAIADEYMNWKRELLAEVQRKAAEEAYERGRLDERHDCMVTTAHLEGRSTTEELQRSLRNRNPYRQKAGE